MNDAAITSRYLICHSYVRVSDGILDELNREPHDFVPTARRGRVASANQLDNAGNASLGDMSPTVEEWVLRSGPADLTPSDAFPGTEYVALLAMVRFSNPA
jgi:hypothetical protein